MDAGGLAQMNANTCTSPGVLGMSSGLATRRGGHNIAPLSFDTIKSANDKGSDGAVQTPRTSRGHMLAGLRTAPRTSSGTHFPSNSVSSPTTQSFSNTNGNNGGAKNNQQYQSHYHTAPKTAMPSYGNHGNSGLNNNNNHNNNGHNGNNVPAQYTVDQVLAPPELQLEDNGMDNIDPAVYAQLMATNLYLAQQQQQLQQQLLRVQAAAQQFQGLQYNNAQQQHQMAMMNQQQQQFRSMQQQMTAMAMNAQPTVYTYIDPVTGQQSYYVDQSAQLANSQFNLQMQQQQQQQQYMEAQQYMNQNIGQPATPPRVQVSPPNVQEHQSFSRTHTPPKRHESPAVEANPLPPPSANAFRRGHSKIASLNLKGIANVAVQDAPKSAGPRTPSFPSNQFAAGGYGPGQARAGDHPTRQPRGPPAMEELVAKPTAKHEGSKNFAARTRRSAVHNLVKAGLVRRKGTNSSSGSMSPVSESADDVETPTTDNESDCSGSNSLAGEVEASLPSSRSSASSTWGAIGSNRPISRQNTRQSVDSVQSYEGEQGTFANVFKHGAQTDEVVEGQRRTPMLVLTGVDKRRSLVF